MTARPLTMFILFILLTLAIPTQAAPTTATLNGMVINEVMVSPFEIDGEGFDTDGSGFADNLDEYIELYNLSENAVDIGGWQLWDFTPVAANNWYIFPSNSVIAPGGFALIIAGVQPEGELPSLPAGSLAFDAGLGGQVIGATGDNVVLLDPTAREYIHIIISDAPDDPLTYDNFPQDATRNGDIETFLPQEDVPEAISLTRTPDGDTNVVRHDVLLTPGSPGTSPDTANPPPTINETTPADGAVDVEQDTDITIVFSQPVQLNDPWYELLCNGGPVEGDYIGSGTTYTITPTQLLTSGADCSVTIAANAVSDLDAPLVKMEQDYTFSFTVFRQFSCSADFTRIPDVRAQAQVGGVGPLITTVGVVTGDFQSVDATPNLQGFYIQTEPGLDDGNPLTSEGIFVYDPDNRLDVSEGQRVFVEGRSERLTQQIRLNVSETVLDARVRLCDETLVDIQETLVALPIDSNGWEPYDGMLIRLFNPGSSLVVTDQDRLREHGEFTVSTGRIPYHTMHNPPTTAEALNAYSEQVNRSTMRINDGSNSLFPDPIPYPPGGLSAINTLRAGYTINEVVGIVQATADTSSLTHTLHPIEPTTFNVAGNPRPSTPPNVGGTLRIAHLTADQFPMGGTAADAIRHETKLANTIISLNADIISVDDVSDSTSADYVAALANAANSRLGSETYASVVTGAIGDGNVRVGLIYKPANVTLVGDFAVLDNSSYGPGNRPALAQTFRDRNNEVFTVVVVDLAARDDLSLCPDEPDNGSGVGTCDPTRLSAAQALSDWIADDPTASGDTDVLIIGDLQSYTQEAPINLLRENGYSDLIDLIFTTSTYNHAYAEFDATSPFGWGTLDYALASPSLVAQITGADFWRINADEPTLLGYDSTGLSTDEIDAYLDESIYASSDRDPLLVGLELAAQSAFTVFSPIGVIDDAYGDPLYTWPALVDALSYTLYVENTATGQAIIYIPQIDPQIWCAGNLCQIDPTTIDEAFRLINGQYHIYVGVQYADEEIWFGSFNFTLDALPPSVPELVETTGTDSGTITLQWQLVDEAIYATWFRLYLAPSDTLGSVALDVWLQRSDVCGVYGTTCTYNANTLVSGVDYQYWLQTIGPGGEATGGITGLPSWVGPEAFTVQATLPQIPTGITVDPQQGRPQVSWTYDPNASWYQLYLGPNPIGTDYLQWHDAATYCDIDSLRCTVEPAIDWTTDGNPYQVWLRGWGPAGFSSTNGQDTAESWNNGAPWSFVEQPASPPTNFGLDNPISPAPSLLWTSGLYTTWVEVYLTTDNFSEVYNLGWHQTATLGCAEGVSTCTLRTAEANVNWQPGSYKVYIRAWGPGGLSPGNVTGAPNFTEGTVVKN